jgi:hypothetical protein
MSDYKHRRIELAPRRQTDGTWHCPYRIIEFRQTCWGYRKGCTAGSFASREEATAAALEEAKRIVDSLEPPPLSGRGSVRGTYGNGMTRLTFYFVRSFVYIGNMVGRSMFFLPMYRTIVNTIKVSAWSRR